MALKLGTLSVDIDGNTTGLKKSEREVSRINKRMGASFSGLGRVIAAAFSIEAARRIINVADSMALVDVRIRNATKSQDEYVKSRARLIQISNKTGTAIAANVKLFEQLARAGQEIGASNPQVLQLTESFNKLGTIGGSSLDAMRNSQMQFSQAMAGGIVRAEEWNSILENTPEVARAIAKGLNKSVGELRNMVVEGELMADSVFNALLSQTDEINKRFETLPMTTARASQEVANNFAQVVDEINKGVNASATLAEAVAGFADKVLEIPNDVRVLFAIVFGEIDQFFARATARLAIIGAQIGGLFDFSDASKQTTALVIEQIEKQRDVRIAASKAAIDAAIDDEARLVAAKRTGAEAVPGAVAATVGGGRAAAGEGAKDSGPNRSDLARLDRIRQLGETEREEIRRIAEEQRAFILAQDQLTADERAALQDKIAAETIGKLQAVNEAEAQAEIAHAAQMTRVKQQQADSLVAAVTSGTSAVSNLLRVTGDEQAARAAAVIQGVAALAAQIVSMMAAQATAQAAADPTAITLPQKIANIAIMTSQFVGIFAALKGGGRQFGGTVSPLMAHPINEAGVPEILSQGGKQFLLPTGKGGTVSPLNGGQGGGGPVNVTLISNGTPQTVTGTQLSRDEIAIMINDAAVGVEGKINSSLATGRGNTARSLQSGFKAERNLR